VDLLVELRGFEPLTSVVQAPARFTAPPLPRAGTAEGALLDPPPKLDRRCFTCSAQILTAASSSGLSG
jgi:hypothetical protein